MKPGSILISVSILIAAVMLLVGGSAIMKRRDPPPREVTATFDPDIYRLISVEVDRQEIKEAGNIRTRLNACEKLLTKEQREKLPEIPTARIFSYTAGSSETTYINDQHN